MTQDLENEELHLEAGGGGMIVLDRVKDARYRQIQPFQLFRQSDSVI